MFEIFLLPHRKWSPVISLEPLFSSRWPHCPNRDPFPRGSGSTVERNIPISNFVGNLIIGSERKISPGFHRKKIEKRSGDVNLISERIKNNKVNEWKGRRKFGVFSRFLPKIWSQTFPSECNIKRIDWIRVDDQHLPTIVRENSNGLTRGKESTYLFLRAEHEKLNRVSHRDCNVPLSLFPSIKAFKMVETLVERISRCVNGALILRKRLRAQIFHLRYAPLSNLSLSYYLQFPYLSFLPLPVSISRNKKYLVESDNAEWQFLESRAEFLISAAIHDNNNAL